MRTRGLDPTPEVALPWLLRLRWVAVASQAATVAVVVWVLGVSLPLPALTTLVGATAASNAALQAWLHRGGRPGPGVVASVVVLDVALLTGLLYLTGGASNPFALLYLVHVTLAALLLEALPTSAVAALCAAGYAALFQWNLPLPELAGHHHGSGRLFQHFHADGVSIHLQGMWFAFSLGAGFIAWSVARLSTTLRRRNEEFAALQDEAERAGRLLSLSTLAGGAAHELGTPLATIAVAARELERFAARTPDGAGAAEDARLIRAEVDRCRDIVHRMAARAGETAGEVAEDVPFEALIDALVASLPKDQRDRLEVRPPGQPLVLRVPRRGTVEVLANLVKNACDADAAGTPVVLTAGRAGERVRLAVEDRGPGMAPDVLQRAGEPFFTTKPLGRGLGLGLFLARACTERAGGRFTLRSRPGEGTVAVVELPAAPKGGAPT